MLEPIRRAILIGSQTPNGTYLPGVESDPRDLKTFLKSPNGGAWQDDEIIVLKNPTCRRVLSIIQSTIADYLFVYFSGHGYAKTKTHRMIALSDGNIQDLQLLNSSPRQLVIVDACRTHERSAAIGSIPWPEEKWHYYTGYSAARAYFNQCIDGSPYGKIIVHATSDNQPAFEGQTGIGGEFTMALLDSVFTYQQSGQRGILPVTTIVQHSAYLLRERKVDQVPCIYKDGYINVPLAIVSPEFITVKPPQKKEIIQEENSLGGLLVVAGLALMAYAVLK